MNTVVCIIFCLYQPPAAPPPVVVTACPRVVAHDAGWQKRAAVALRSTASPEIQAIGQEWLSARDQARACQSAGKAKR